jgi:hypothetical protein
VHHFGTQAPWRPFFKTSKKVKLKLRKISNKIPACSPRAILPVCKFWIRNTLYFILGKNHKNVDWEHEQCNFWIFQNLSNLSFLLSLNYKVLHIKILHACSVLSWLHPPFCFGFFKTLKSSFQFFQKKRLHGARSLIAFFGYTPCYFVSPRSVNSQLTIWTQLRNKLISLTETLLSFYFFTSDRMRKFFVL